jgi:hypothetical protein
MLDEYRYMETRGVAAVGTVRIWNHGGGKYKFKAIKTENGFVHYAPWLYEKTYGPMPANHIVGFKDRDNMNVVPENLEAITRAEHARRGGGNRKLPAELKDAEKNAQSIKSTNKNKTKWQRLSTTKTTHRLTFRK